MFKSIQKGTFLVRLLHLTGCASCVSCVSVVPTPTTLTCLFSMQNQLKIAWFLVTTLLAAAAPTRGADLIPLGSSWKYFIGTQPASSPPEAWRDRTFSDATWSSGTAPLGYDTGGTPGTTPIVTLFPDPRTAGNPVWTNACFRKTFNVVDPLAVSELILTVLVDDGAVAWINGEEVGRINVTGTAFTPISAADVADETRTLTTTNIASKLVQGNNVIAIQGFNGAAASSDFVFEAVLTSFADEPPTVFSIDPTPTGIVQSLSIINIAFNENVSGVDAADLLINSVAAASVVQNNPRDYTFQFPQPTTTGTVTVAWANNPGINDIDGVPQAFVPGPSWVYTLDPNAIAEAAVISEFMADNESALYQGRAIIDEDGTRADWLELYNPGLVDLSLNGWFLTDVPVNASPSSITNLTKWRLPNVVLGPNKYLLIWASEKNRSNPSGPLHTNFRLSRNAGSYLALVDPSTNVVSSFSGSTYPAQQTDVSYGRDRVDPNLLGYFVVPTPGAQNETSGIGFAAQPTVSHESGVYTNATLSFVINVPPGTTVRYTTDGSQPTNSSILYSAPIALQNNTTIKLRAFPSAAGLFPSPVLVRNFLFLDASTRDFNSNLPVLVLSTEGRAMVQGVPSGSPRTKGTFVVFDTFRGRSAFSRKPDYIGPADFEVFGQTSAGFPKQPYNVELQDAFGNDKKESILGLPEEADWKLRNPYADKCLMNDFLAYEMFEQMGNYSCRRKFVEVFVDTGGARLSYPADYIGVEVFLEKIERGNDRVDIAELTRSHTNEPSITGGFIFKKDKDSPGDINISAGGNTIKVHEPKPQSLRNTPSSAITTFPGANYTPSASNQLGYLMNYLNGFNNAMNAADWTTRTGTNHYSHYIDVDSFVDSHWIVEFPKQIDGYRISNFFRKERNGKVKNAPVWDWNLAFGNADYLDGGHTNGWYYPLISAGEHIWLRRLVGATALPNSGGDPDFIQKVIDRWGVLRTNIMNGDRVVARIDELANQLTEAAGRNFTKYNYINTYQWPNPQGPPTWDVDYTQPTYELIISEMKKWTAGRYVWVDNQFPKGPVLGLPEGEVAAGSSLIIAAAAGTIYYTLDGTDPRALQANGAIAGNALTYSAPITINANARVFARARVGTVWSPPAIATYVVSRPRLVISEIMYHPLPPIPGPGVTNIDEDFEYVEVMNVGAGSLNLNGYTIRGGIDFTFPNQSLAAGQRLVVVNQRYAFTNRYGAAANSLVVGEFTGNLANDNNRLILEGRLREPLLDFSYDDDWYPITDGFGFSLVIVDENAAASTWGLASSWRPSGVLNGTPGQADPVATFPHVVVNEALTHSDPPPPTDTVELRNLSATSASVAGWYLSDDFSDPKKYRIPSNTADIPAGGYLTFDESNFNPDGEGFAFSSSGDEVYLFSADVDGNLTGYYHGFQVGPQRTGVTFGRHVTSVGEEHFVAQASATLGGANSGPLVGPVVISEIMYHPQDVFANGAFWNNEEDEFIELRNISGSPVNLFDPAHATNTWKLDNAVEFTFPTNRTVPAGAYVLVVNFNPTTDVAQLAAFRAKYGVSASIPIYGPYKGNLANGDENVSLYRPDNPETNGPIVNPAAYVLVDAVRYSDQAPWPIAADGMGHSLHRLDVSAYGNDPVNWAAGAPTAGSGFSGGTSPTITAQPANQTVPETGTATFSGAGSGPGPLTYQWRFNDSVLSGATNSTLVLANVQASQAGQYRLVVLNPFGSALSSVATLTVLIPAHITQQPASLKVAEGANVSFSVIATTFNPPLMYQWRRNGLPIAGATGASYPINNVTDIHEGDYTCALTDGNGTIFSVPASLKVLILPTMISPNPAAPLQLTAVAGETVTFSAVTRGTKPMLYRWRRITPAGAGAIFSDQVLNANTGFLTIPSVAATHVGFWTLILTNELFTTPNVARTNAILTVLADSNLNGIPDVWESSYFGSTTGAERDLDSDGDGMSNWQEYTAGTNPTNAASYLKVGGINPNGGADVTFEAMANKTYTVEYRDGLDTLIWTPLGDVVARGSNWVATVTDPAPGANRYYRLVTPRRP
jgi:hypothetical protein